MFETCCPNVLKLCSKFFSFDPKSDSLSGLFASICSGGTLAIELYSPHLLIFFIFFLSVYSTLLFLSSYKPNVEASFFRNISNLHFARIEAGGMERNRYLLHFNALNFSITWQTFKRSFKLLNTQFRDFGIHRNFYKVLKYSSVINLL